MRAMTMWRFIDMSWLMAHASVAVERDDRMEILRNVIFCTWIKHMLAFAQLITLWVAIWLCIRNESLGRPPPAQRYCAAAALLLSLLIIIWNEAQYGDLVNGTT